MKAWNITAEEVLQCGHLDKEGRFYQVGRLASISSIHILHEKENSWTRLKDMVNNKPHPFFKAWFEHEISQVLDEEDLGMSIKMIQNGVAEDTVVEAIKDLRIMTREISELGAAAFVDYI